MKSNRAGILTSMLLACTVFFDRMAAQCPQIPTSDAIDHTMTLCEGSSLTMIATGLNLAPGSTVDWYLLEETANPYNGGGELLGSSLVTGDQCLNTPEVLYVMVNPDNVQAGGPGDQCDEFIVLWTGSGGYSTSDILVTNLGPGTFQWNSFVEGNAGTFSCGTPLPPGPVPPNAILIIQSSPDNNVTINSAVLCASGLPVYVIAYDGTTDCTGGYFDNNSPCSSCPVMIALDGALCQFNLAHDYMPPGTTISGWAWANTGTGIFADIIPPLNFPVWIPENISVEDFIWTVPDDFCETLGGNATPWYITGIPNPPPPAGCPQITTPYFDIHVACPEISVTGGGEICAGNCPDAPAEIAFALSGGDAPYTIGMEIGIPGFPVANLQGLQIDDDAMIGVCVSGNTISFDPVTTVLTIPEAAAGETVTIEIMPDESASGCSFDNSQGTVIEFTILPSVEIEVITPVVICSNEDAWVQAMVTGGNVTCIWETGGDGVFSDPFSEGSWYTPGPFDLSNGSVVLTFTPADPDICLAGNEPVLLEISPAFETQIPPPQNICAGDTASLVIDITGDYTTVTWSTTGDGVLDELSPFEVEYIPGPLDIAGQFVIISVMIQSAYPACGVTTYNLPVNITDCNCPPFVTVPPSSLLCFDLASLDLSTLLIEGGAGIWSITSAPAGGNPAVVNGDLFITSQSDAGEYIITYTLDAPEPGCPPSSSETIIVQGLIQAAAGADQSFCGPATVMLAGNVSPPGTLPVMWNTQGDGVFSHPNSLSTLYIPGTVDSVSGEVILVFSVLDTVCPVQFDTVVLRYQTPPFAQFVSDTVTVCNAEEFGAVIDFFSLIDGGDMSGTWSNPNGVPVDFSTPDSVNFNGIAEGFYVFEYRTLSAVPPCNDIAYSLVISVVECNCPLLQIQQPHQGVCHTLASLPLNAFIQAGAPGNWQITGVPPGQNPGTEVNDIFLINGCDQGLYGFLFTFNTPPGDGCPDSARITVFVQEPPSLVLPDDLATCGMDPVALEAAIGGSAAGLIWSTTGSGIFTIPIGISTAYIPSVFDVASAFIELVAVTTDTFGYCPAASDTVDLFLVTPPSTGFISLIDTLCNHADSNQVLDLLSYIFEGDATGFWTDIDGAMVDLDDPSHVDFSGVPPGMYRLRYTTQTAVAPCTDSVYTFTLVVEDCGCTLLAENIADTLRLCPGDTLVLIPFVTGAQGLPFSTWITPSGTKMIPALPVIDPGQYIWIVRDSAGCEVRDTFRVEFIGPQNAVISLRPASCAGIDNGAVIIESVEEGTPPYTVQIDAAALVWVAQLPHTFEGQDAGSHVLTIIDGTGCEIMIPVQIGVESDGHIDLGPDRIVPAGDSVFIEPSLQNIVPQAVTWDPPGLIQHISPFWYMPEVTTLITLTIIDTSGCVHNDQVLITVFEEVNMYIANVFSPNGDNINDILEVNSNIPDGHFISFEIFDRWGGLIHGQYGNAPFSWNGTSNGKPAMTGVYVYKVVWKDEQGRVMMKAGDITLVN